MKNLTNEQAANGLNYKTANLLADIDSNFTEHEGDIALLAPKANPTFTGSVTVPTPTSANEAATKGYVDVLVSLGVAWVSPVTDIVAVLPVAGPPALGTRYILSTNNHIYAADGAGNWTDNGVSVGWTTYVTSDIDAPANNVGWYNYNGTAWVYIGTSSNHNDLGAIDGGAAGEYYHLTQAQHTVATQAATDAVSGYLSASDHATFNAKAPTANPTLTGTVTVPDHSFTYAKLQSESADTILGRDSSAGNVIEIPCTPVGRSILDDTTTAAVRTTIGLGNVTNESKATMFTNPTFTGTVSGVTKSMVGLGNVDNTSDLAKPISTATQAALNLKANLASPTFTGTPLAPTAAPGTNTTQIATTAFVQAAIGTGGVSTVLTDGVSTFRMIVRDAALCFDMTLTALGFAGVENVDWIEINSFA